MLRPGLLAELQASPAQARPGPSMTSLPMVLLAIQEAAARAATRDQHLRRSAHPPVAETTSTIQVLARQRPLKNGPRGI